MHFGIREHVMASTLNGLAQSKLRGSGSTFLIFSDYGRPAIRLSALMGMPTIHVFTHDSIGVGEDGPTHQPIEHLMSLRAIPNMYLIRPADANEVTEAWKVIAKLQHNPVCLCLTRQALPVFDRTKYAPAAGVAKGGYVLADAAGGKPDILLIATGSEVQHCVAAHERLTAEGVKARVVSLSCWEIFQSQPPEYRDSVIPPGVKARVTVEMGTTMGWERYAGPTGTMIGMRSFGASAPLKDLLKEFGFTADTVYQAAKKGNFRSPMTNTDKAVDFVAQGMTVGLGSGHAAERFIRALADRAKGGLHIRCVATSKGSADIAASLGLHLVTLDEVAHLDLTVDGADEVDPNLNLIKGYGLAHVREKIVAAASRRFVILIGPEMVREKLVPVLGTRGKLPVEVIAFGLAVCRAKLEEMGIASAAITQPDGELALSDNGNPVLSCRVGPIDDPAGLERQIRSIPGVVGTGLFVGMADAVIIQDGSEVEVRQRPALQ